MVSKQNLALLFIKRLVLIIALFIFFSPLSKISADENSIVINEISANNETDWIEVYNISGESIDLSEYQLIDESNNLQDLDCFLSSSGVFAVDWSNRLNNGGDRIILQKNGENIDCVAYGDGSFCEGKSHVDLQSLEEGKYGARDPEGSGNWMVKDNNTKADNSNCVLIPTITPTPTSTPTDAPANTPTSTPTPTSAPTATETPTPTSESTSTSYDNIYISEFLADPENGNEKVEIKNGNSFTVSLTNWQIDDLAEEGKDPKKFSTEISANGFYIFEISSGMFNNGGDEVRLLDFDGVEKDKKSYSSSTKGKSWSKDENETWCQTDSSFGQENPDCPLESTPTLTTTPTFTPTPTDIPQPTDSSSNKVTFTPTASTSSVLGALDFFLPTATPSATPEADLTFSIATAGSKMSSRRKLSYFFLGLGSLFLSVFAYSILQVFRKRPNKIKEILNL